MSQEKVDRYKKEKANRKEIMRKKQRAAVLRIATMCVVGVLLLGWIGYSAYNLHEEKQPRKVAEIDYTSINGYLQSLELSE